MGNTTGNNLPHKKKKITKGEGSKSVEVPIQETTLEAKDSTTNSYQEYNYSDHEWIRQLPHEILCEVLEFADLPPRTILTLQTLSSYWRDVFKSNNIWKLMCRYYGMHSAYFKDDTDYFKLFLSRYSVNIIPEKNYRHYIIESKKDGDYKMFQSVKTSNIPGQPDILVGRIYMHSFHDDDQLKNSFENYDRVFKNQRVHPNLAVQNIFKQDSIILIYSEPSDDFLMDYLTSNPQKVTEANICDIIKQIMLAVDWLAERKVYSYYFNLESFRINILPDNKVQVKFYSAIFDMSGNRPGYGSPNHVPPEVLVVEPTSDKTYSWMIGNKLILSIGWIACVLLEGLDPFVRETMPETFWAILAADYSFADSKNNHVIPLARDFISKLLVKEQSARMSLKDALKHEWIQSPNKSHEPMQHIVEALQAI